MNGELRCIVFGEQRPMSDFQFITKKLTNYIFSLESPHNSMNYESGECRCTEAGGDLILVEIMWSSAHTDDHDYMMMMS